MEAYSTLVPVREADPRGPDPRRCAVCGGANRKPPKPGICTYFLLQGGYLKIGSTADLKARLKALSRGRQTVLGPADMDWSAPVSLLMVLPGDVEHQMHEGFRTCHVTHEWFDPAGVQDIMWGRYLMQGHRS